MVTCMHAKFTLFVFYCHSFSYFKYHIYLIIICTIFTIVTSLKVGVYVIHVN